MTKEVYWFTLVIGVCFGCFITSIYCENFSADYSELMKHQNEVKAQCEENLPRNQFCEIIITAKPISESGE
jgi:hypothetical protein